ncbi:MAG: HEAT repeat domain-containing protein [Candidatus Kryptoniota bacterium]
MENDIAVLVKKLFSDDGIERRKARHDLVKIGMPAISFLVGLQYVPQQHVRWEAIKTISQVADPEAIPVLVNALENSNLDVRWLAAEGLIEIGEASLAALLLALEEHGDSVTLKVGAHHVLKGLEEKGLFTDHYGIIGMLEDPLKYEMIRPTATKIRLQH